MAHVLEPRGAHEPVERRHLIRHKYNKVATAFIANSTHTFDYYRRVLPHHMRSDVVLIPYWFNYDRFFNPEVEPPEDAERVRLVNVGSFQDKKNQAFIVDIARELLGRGLDFEITPPRRWRQPSPLWSRGGAAGLDDRVLFHGNVHGVERWMCDSHIYVHTARYEPFGLVLLEAMAAGLPCVTLDGKGNRDLIEDGQNGFLLEREDASALRIGSCELARDREQYREMSAYAQSFAKRTTSSWRPTAWSISTALAWNSCAAETPWRQRHNFESSADSEVCPATTLPR